MVAVQEILFGADVIYYHGVITRNFNTIISPMIEEKPQRSMLGTQRETYSQAGVTLGIQYDFILNDNRSFTFGATFRPRVNLRPETTRTIVARTPLSTRSITRSPVPIITCPLRSRRVCITRHARSAWGSTIRSKSGRALTSPT
ncbi:MAG: hypothetical protein ACLR8Y_06190 [Alistipes indistinctus]